MRVGALRICISADMATFLLLAAKAEQQLSCLAGCIANLQPNMQRAFGSQHNNQMQAMGRVSFGWGM